MKRVAISVALMVLTIGVLVAQSDLQPIANVKLQKTEPITLKQLKARVEAYTKELGRDMTIEEKKKVLDTIINERLVVQAAEKEGLKVSDSEVNQSFAQIISQQVGRQVTEIEFAQMIREKSGMSLDDYMRAQNGMNVSEYKAFLRSQMIAQRYVMLKKKDEIQNTQAPTDADIRSYYDVHKQNFVQPDIAKLFLVIVPKGDSVSAAETKIQDLRKQLVDKAPSLDEIKSRSQVANSGYQAGDLFINKNSEASKKLGISMDALLKIFAMEVGQISEVNETATDYQCFTVLDKYPAKILDLSDVVKPGTTVTVYEFIRGNMISQVQNRAVANALMQIINDLRKPENFQIMRSDAEMEKILSW